MATSREAKRKSRNTEGFWHGKRSIRIDAAEVAWAESFTRPDERSPRSTMLGSKARPRLLGGSANEQASHGNGSCPRACGAGCGPTVGQDRLRQHVHGSPCSYRQ